MCQHGAPGFEHVWPTLLHSGIWRSQTHGVGVAVGLGVGVGVGVGGQQPQQVRTRHATSSIPFRILTSRFPCIPSRLGVSSQAARLSRFFLDSAAEPRLLSGPQEARVRKRERERIAKSMTRSEVAAARTPEEREMASKIASMLGRRRALLAGSEGMSELGRKGSRAYWDSMTKEERSLEAKRRLAVRKANRRKRLEVLLARTK